MIPSNVSFFSGFLWLLKIFCSSKQLNDFLFFENAIWILMGIRLNLCTALGNIAFLILLIFIIYKIKYLFISLCLQLFSTIDVIYISLYRFVIFFVKFVPSYYILYIAVANGIVIFIYFSDISLCIYRSAMHLCTLIFVLQHFCNCLLLVMVSGRISRIFLYIKLCHLQKMTLLSHSQFRCFLLFSLVQLLWLELPVVY